MDENGGLALDFTTNSGENVGVAETDAALFNNAHILLTADGYDEAYGIVNEDGYKIVLRNGFIEGIGYYDYSNYSITLADTPVYLTVEPIEADDERVVVTFSDAYQANNGLIYNGNNQYIKDYFTVSYPTNVWGNTYENNVECEIVSGASGSNAGDYTAVISFADNTKFTGTRNVDWKIIPEAIDTSAYSYDVADVSYGTALSYAIDLTAAPFNTMTDPTLTYTFYKKNANNTYTKLNGVPVDVGSYKVEATAVDQNQSAAVEDEFTIKPFDASGTATAQPVSSFTYNSEEREQKFTVKVGNVTLEEDKDYVLSNNKQTNAGSFTATITFQSNYCGSTTAAWSITKKPLASSDVTEPTARILTYDASAQDLITAGNTAGGTMKYFAVSNTELDSEDLTDNEIIVYFIENKQQFDAEVPQGTFADKSYVAYYVDGGTNFEDTEIAFLTVDIQQKAISIYWSGTSLTYNGNAQKPTATAGGLCGNDECNITVNGAQTNAGAYTATAASLNNSNYKLPENVTCAFTIAAKILVNADITVTGAYTYTGSTITPTVTVKDGDIVIDPGEYNVNCDDANAGQAPVTITDVKGGNYTVSGTAHFEIAAKAVVVTPDA